MPRLSLSKRLQHHKKNENKLTIQYWASGPISMIVACKLQHFLLCYFTNINDFAMTYGNVLNALEI